MAQAERAGRSQTAARAAPWIVQGRSDSACGGGVCQGWMGYHGRRWPADGRCSDAGEGDRALLADDALSRRWSRGGRGPYPDEPPLEPVVLVGAVTPCSVITPHGGSARGWWQRAAQSSWIGDVPSLGAVWVHPVVWPGAGLMVVRRYGPPPSGAYWWRPDDWALRPSRALAGLEQPGCAERLGPWDDTTALRRWTQPGASG